MKKPIALIGLTIFSFASFADEYFTSNFKGTLTCEMEEVGSGYPLGQRSFPFEVIYNGKAVILKTGIFSKKEYARFHRLNGDPTLSYHARKEEDPSWVNFNSQYDRHIYLEESSNKSSSGSCSWTKN